MHTSVDSLEGFAGTIITPDSPEYASAARTALGTAHPAIVLRPADVVDVQRAVRFAAASDRPLVIRGGGHSAAGLSTVDDGIVIDLGALDAVELLDERRVRVGGGALWRQVAETLAPHGLAISSGDTADVGVGGLTLSGGIGWMVRRHGLTLDHLRAVELVTADGEVLRVDEHAHADLFWALRGGGGAYGVVTAFEFEAQPTPGFAFAVLTFPADRAARVVPAWADVMRTAAEEISSTLVLANPLAGGREAPIQVTFARSDGGDVCEVVAALRAVAAPLTEDVRQAPYLEILHDGQELPEVLRVALRSGFVSVDAADAAVTSVVDMAAQEQPAAITLHALGGAFGAVPADATAFAHRSAVLMVSTFAVAPVPAYDGLLARMEALWRPLAPLTTGAYANSIDGTAADAVASVYPERTRGRLGEIKRRYDSANLFSRTFVPAPASAR
ncbi:FAD-dependent oxidoreductase [Microbacterium sp. M28]|uniref:FAD-binding oxidoreductase n=1 Tax=Microbacterium sp. M28 TaxID=2962064 RepID=UPI0021F43B16|nr:FAD-dependent oxidoreductase [Microbacterium sp. M28]UYO97376.1 FAD-dependent oxidoreductase [Microbacterium sp. M28]